MLFKLLPIAEGLSPITNRRFLRVMSGRFLKTQMMRASAFNYAALNKDAQIIHNVHGSLLCVEGVNKELTFIVSNGWPITRPVAPKG